MKTPTPKKPKRAGRVMWMAGVYTGCYPIYLHTEQWEAEKAMGNSIDEAIPVLVLPLGDVQALVESRAQAIACEAGHTHWHKLPLLWKSDYLSTARATLLADGVPAKLLKT